MQNKIYTFNGEQFTLRKNNLDLMNKANEMLVTYRKKLFEYTSDLDMHEADYYRNQIEEYKISISFIEKRIEGAKASDNVQEVQKEQAELNRVNALLAELEDEFNADIKLQNLIKLESECRNSVLLAIMTDKELMKKTLYSILKGDCSKLDFESPEIFIFIREVITDFFIFTGTLSKTYQNSNYQCRPEHFPSADAA